MCFLQPLVATACGDIVTLLARKQHATHAVAAANLQSSRSLRGYKGSGSLSMSERKNLNRYRACLTATTYTWEKSTFHQH